MAKKYAVRVGVNPGVYDTWAEAEKQVKGFAGAKYRSFKSSDVEAIAEFMAIEDGVVSHKALSKEELRSMAEALELLAEKHSKLKDTVSVFTDGSNKTYGEDSQIYGFGFLVLDDGEVVHEGKGASVDPKYTAYRNVAGEITGAVRALNYVEKKMPNVKKIHLFYDYQGIGEWTSRNWKAKNDMSQTYVDFVEKFKNRTGIEIDFVHVKGHSDNKYNERVDVLASEGIDEYLKEHVS